MNFSEAAHAIHTFRTQSAKDVYAKWILDFSHWQLEPVRQAFEEVKHFIQTELPKQDLKSCVELDLKLLHLMERHVSEGMPMAYFQAVFVALILEALDVKRHDDYGKKHVTLLTYSYRSRLLSFFLSEMLRENMVDFVLATYKDEETRHNILGFFGV